MRIGGCAIEEVSEDLMLNRYETSSCIPTTTKITNITIIIINITTIMINSIKTTIKMNLIKTITIINNNFNDKNS